MGFVIWNEMVCDSRRPVTFTVYMPAAIPLVPMVTLTVPLPSGPLTTSGCGEASRGPVRTAVTSSQVCPGTVEAGSA